MLKFAKKNTNLPRKCPCPIANTTLPSLLLPQEWEAFSGQLVTDIKANPAAMRYALPQWVDEERTLSVTTLKVGSPSPPSR